MQVIQFIDLQAQRKRLADKLNDAIGKVLTGGQYILGSEVTTLESELAEFCGADHAIACASGTDALTIALMALGVKPGDAVFVPAFTFVATAEAVALSGATPFFVDVKEDSFNMDIESLEAAISGAKALRLDPRIIIPVDMYGNPADYQNIKAIAARWDLKIIADAAQSFGASVGKDKVGTFGDIACTSFYPAKPLGCYGDGGALFTNDETLKRAFHSILNHGQGARRYEHDRLGINGRLDTLQAAIILVKITIYADEMKARVKVAKRYSDGLQGVCKTPAVKPGVTPAWAQYTILVPERDRVAERLREKGIPTAIHYPQPLNTQKPYRHYPVVKGGVSVSEQLAKRVLSLPMHPYLKEDQQDHIITAVGDALA